MSIYEIVQKISLYSKIYKFHEYHPNDVIAKLYMNEKVINYHYSDHHIGRLEKEATSELYDCCEISLDFWDPKFCTKEMIMREDIDYVKEILNIEDTKDVRSVVVGYIVSLIGIYNIILKSYTTTNFYEVLNTVDFDKSILRKVFMQVNVVVDLSLPILDLIKITFDEDQILEFLTTPSGNFRFSLRDVSYILKGTSRTHEISSIICKTVKNDLLALRYIYELLSVCSEIYSPKVIRSYKTDNVLLNILKLNIDLDKYENVVFSTLDMYTDKGGSLDVLFDISKQDDKYDNMSVLLETIKEYHSS